MNKDAPSGYVGSLRPSLVLAFVTVAIHLSVNRGYGIFRDELYFIVCGRHPAFGYVDQPPLIPLLAAGSYGVFGNWLVGFRLIPTFALAATVALTAEFARILGGGRFAQCLAGFCALAAPQFLAIGLLFTTDTFVPLTWLGCCWFLVRLEQSGDERWWIPFGLALGFSLQTKYLMAFYVFALAVGLLATPLRRSLLRPWVYLAIVIASALVLPNVVWQGMQGWPFLELGKAAAHGKNIALSPSAFLGQQILLLGPASAPVWIAALWVCVRRPQLWVFRALPIAYVLLFAYFVIAHGKAYYLSYFYPTLFAIGSVEFEKQFHNIVVRTTALVAVAVCGAIIAPLAIPVLPEMTYIAYAASLGLGPNATAAEHLKLGLLPQHFADMHGWQEMAEKVAVVYHALPPDDRAKAVFFGHNYGESAAIDVFGASLGMPPAIGDHNQYGLWGPRGADGSVLILVGGNRAEYEGKFRSVTVAGKLDNPYAMPYETDMPIYVLRGLNQPLADLWPKIRHYN